MHLDQDSLDDLAVKLSELLEVADNFRTLKHQYGIASRRIHELKCENALLREKLRDAGTVGKAQVFNSRSFEDTVHLWKF